MEVMEVAREVAAQRVRQPMVVRAYLQGVPVAALVEHQEAGSPVEPVVSMAGSTRTVLLVETERIGMARMDLGVVVAALLRPARLWAVMEASMVRAEVAVAMADLRSAAPVHKG
jgi:hypothetical protein